MCVRVCVSVCARAFKKDSNKYSSNDWTSSPLFSHNQLVTHGLTNIGILCVTYVLFIRILNPFISDFSYHLHIGFKRLHDTNIQYVYDTPSYKQTNDTKHQMEKLETNFRLFCWFTFVCLAVLLVHFLVGSSVNAYTPANLFGNYPTVKQIRWFYSSNNNNNNDNKTFYVTWPLLNSMRSKLNRTKEKK